jgi:hypothetical protein
LLSAVFLPDVARVGLSYTWDFASIRENGTNSRRRIVHLRNKRTGAIITAALELCPNRGNGTHFAIRLWLPDGNCRLIGRMESAIGYELVAWNTPELAALLLAGFRIVRADSKTKPSTISALLKVLHVRPRKKTTPTRNNGRSTARRNSAATTSTNEREIAPNGNGMNAPNWHQPADGTMRTMAAGS